MVIGVEGNVHVGKTTFIKNKFKTFNVIEETKFKADLNNYERQLYYIEKEISKKNKLVDNTILDRTIISIIIYTMYTNTLNQNEKKKLLTMINEIINKNEVIIPSFIYLVLYPYKLIALNHIKEQAKKGTQNSLVDYDYYLKYTLFFSNRNYAFNRIIMSTQYRQILSYDSNIFYDATNSIKTNSKILLDGHSITKKKMIGIHQKKYKYIAGHKYTQDDYISQIDATIKKLNEENIILDNSFLFGITYLLYSQPSSKQFKLKIIDEIMKKVPLNNYVTKIVYLVPNRDNNYLNLEAKFYIVLNKRLGKMSNIKFIDSSKNTNELIKNIENIHDKPLLLIDLFYEIKEGIKEGEL